MLFMDAEMEISYIIFMCHEIFFYPNHFKISNHSLDPKLTLDSMHLYSHTSKLASQKVEFFKLPKKKNKRVDYEETQIVMKIVFLRSYIQTMIWV